MVNNDGQIDISNTGDFGSISIRGNIVYFKGISSNTGEYKEYGYIYSWDSMLSNTAALLLVKEMIKVHSPENNFPP